MNKKEMERKSRMHKFPLDALPDFHWSLTMWPDAYAQGSFALALKHSRTLDRKWLSLW